MSLKNGREITLFLCFVMFSDHLLHHLFFVFLSPVLCQLDSVLLDYFSIYTSSYRHTINTPLTHSVLNLQDFHFVAFRGTYGDDR